MSIIHEKTPDGHLIKVEELSLSREIADEFKRIAAELVDKAQGDIIIDLSQTQYIDSSGVGKILFILNKTKSAGKNFYIRAIHDQLYSFFASISLDKLMDIRR
ncbi:MAG: hypothetical protein A2096_11835 [Spirochaetes bacterium GWF1_41_5]|nr:MAG: hypothetical protein A2096_11835 [Spirochaetes bacterium GWF1_41_5]